MAKKIDFDKLKETVTIDVLGEEVQVKAVIDFNFQHQLIAKYLKNMFGEDDSHTSLFENYCSRDRMMAETSLRHDLWIHMTDIEFPVVTSGEKSMAQVPERFLFDDGLYYELTHAIENWDSFTILLMQVVRDVEAEILVDSSVGVVIDDVVQQILAFVKSDENLDISKINKALTSLRKSVEKSNLAGLMDESQA